MKNIHCGVPDDDTVAGRRATDLGEIWIVPECITVLDTLIKPTHVIFEWGAGGSTIWFARRCKHLTTVEQYPRWQIWVTNRLRDEGLSDKVDLYFAPIIPNTPNEVYTHSILAFPDEHFDVVAPDGDFHTRRDCIKHGIGKLKPGGMLLIDNGNWYDWRDLVEGWDETQFITTEREFLGKPFEWATSIVIKPK